MVENEPRERTRDTRFRANNAIVWGWDENSKKCFSFHSDLFKTLKYLIRRKHAIQVKLENNTERKELNITRKEKKKEQARRMVVGLLFFGSAQRLSHFPFLVGGQTQKKVSLVELCVVDSNGIEVMIKGWVHACHKRCRRRSPSKVRRIH